MVEWHTATPPQELAERTQPSTSIPPHTHLDWVVLQIQTTRSSHPAALPPPLSLHPPVLGPEGSSEHTLGTRRRGPAAGVPVDLLLREVRPVDDILGDFHIQSHCIFEAGYQAGVLAAIQGHLPDFMAVGEEKVCNCAWTWGRGRREGRWGPQRLWQAPSSHRGDQHSGARNPQHGKAQGSPRAPCP